MGTRNKVVLWKHINNLGAVVKKLASLIELPEASDNCIIWMGYGNIHIKTGIADRLTTIGVHRLSYLLFLGNLDQIHHIHHYCGNKGCLNPLHLTSVNPQHHTIIHDDERTWVKDALTNDNPHATVMADKIRDVVKQPVSKIYSFRKIMDANPKGRRKARLLRLSDNPAWHEFVNFIYEPQFEQTAADLPSLMYCSALPR